MLKPFRVLSASVLAFATMLSACSGDDDDGTEPTPTLDPPTGVTVTATSAFTAHVTWTAATGATSYVIQRADGATGDQLRGRGHRDGDHLRRQRAQSGEPVPVPGRLGLRHDHQQLHRGCSGHHADRARPPRWRSPRTSRRTPRGPRTRSTSSRGSSTWRTAPRSRSSPAPRSWATSTPSGSSLFVLRGRQDQRAGHRGAADRFHLVAGRRPAPGG